MILFILFNKFGLILISKIVGGSFTVAVLILNLSNIKTINKKVLATVMTTNTVLALLVLYAMAFHDGAFIGYMIVLYVFYFLFQYR